MHLLPLVVSLATDPVPDDNSVKAGWTAFAVFLLLCAAVVFLAFSLRKQFKKVAKAREEGVFGDDADSAHTTTAPSSSGSPS